MRSAIFIAKNIRRIAAVKNLSFSDISAKSGIDKANVSRYLSGQKIPNVNTLIKFADVLEVALDELVTASDDGM